MRSRVVRPEKDVLGPALAATSAATVAVLPAFLIGSVGFLIRADLGFSTASLGMLVAVFFLGSVLTAVPAGRVAERFGSRRSSAVATGFTSLVLAFMALASDYLQLAVLFAGAGAANGLAQPTANMTIAQLIPDRRQGLVMGLKQASAPAAGIVAGFSLPVVAVPLGWRPVFFVSSVVGLVVLFFNMSAVGPDRPSGATSRPRVEPNIGRGPLVILAVGGGLASAAAFGFAAFAVESAIATGIDASAAGIVFSLGSGLGLLSRTAAGWAADLLDRRRVASLMASGVLLGAGGYALLAFVETIVPYVAAVFVVFAFGWMWPGLLNLIVVRAYPGAPARASANTMAGTLTGAIVGPTLIGWLASAGSFRVAWLAVSAGACLGSLLLKIGAESLRKGEVPVDPGGLPRGVGPQQTAAGAVEGPHPVGDTP